MYDPSLHLGEYLRALTSIHQSNTTGRIYKDFPTIMENQMEIGDEMETGSYARKFLAGRAGLSKQLMMVVSMRTKFRKVPSSMHQNQLQDRRESLKCLEP